MLMVRRLFVVLVGSDLVSMWVRVAGLLAVAVVMSGCTSVSEGSPVGVVTSEVSTSETFGAPRVSDPLDASGFLERPCAVLTPAQLAEFNVSKPGEPNTEGAIAQYAGPSCIWQREDTPLGSVLGVGFLTGNENGLSDTYRGRDRFERFVETTVDGYPAVFNDFIEGPPNGNCNITVGISDTLTFRAREGGGPKGEIICDRAKQLASAVLTTLKAGA